MDNLHINFSGGRTSAVMTKLILDNYKDSYNISVSFANTGVEHNKTLEFIDKCDRFWGFNTVWLEAVVSPIKGVGIRHKIVDFESASRNGEPFEDVISKYGIPNMTTPHCTQTLKIDVIKSFIKRELQWKNYTTAIGIRSDEIDRMNPKYEENKIWYPLIDWGWTKERVNAFMKKAPFDLALPSDAFGNCVGCWKKSKRKLGTIALDEPHHFDFFRRMEEKYGRFKGDAAAGDWNGDRWFYRGNQSVEDIFNLAHSQGFERYDDPRQTNIWDELDLGGACDQGCEPDLSEDNEPL